MQLLALYTNSEAGKSQMISGKNTALKISSPSLEISASIVPWDTIALGFPVASIEFIKINDSLVADKEFDTLFDWVDDREVRLISCRIKHSDIWTSIFLESKGFNFIEMVLHPFVSCLQSLKIESQDFDVTEVLENEIGIIEEMASRAFGYERFHIDPRINSNLANERYRRWIQNAVESDEQCLVKISNSQKNLGFFIYELRPDGTAYWHLTAVNPDLLGAGIGTAVWYAMMEHSKSLGAGKILTTISARNVPALNLYSKLNFRFAPPEITLHRFK
jgi:RimJ/RimL family protein N-acetyltransferase